MCQFSRQFRKFPGLLTFLPPKNSQPQMGWGLKMNCFRQFLHKISWVQECKENHKLNSKQISKSAFDAHLSFCQKQETIKRLKIKLKTHSSNSGSCNQNSSSIKYGKRKVEKVTARFSVICTNISPYDRPAFIWFAFGVSQKIPCHLATVNHARDAGLTLVDRIVANCE